MNKKPILFLLSICLLVVALTGCACQKTPTPSPSTSPAVTPPPVAPKPSTEPSVLPEASPMTSPDASMMPSDPEASGDTAELSTKVSEALGMMSEMDEAAVLISGTTALVAVKYDTQYEGGITERLQTAVEEKVTELAPNVTETIVTDNPELYDQIKDMHTQWTGGTAWDTLKDAFTTLLDKVKSTVDKAGDAADSSST